MAIENKKTAEDSFRSIDARRKALGATMRNRFSPPPGYPSPHRDAQSKNDLQVKSQFAVPMTAGQDQSSLQILKGRDYNMYHN